MEGNRGCGVRLGSECGSLEGKAGHVMRVSAEDDRMVKVSDSDFFCFSFFHLDGINTV